jgi:hypothetical protein
MNELLFVPDSETSARTMVRGVVAGFSGQRLIVRSPVFGERPRLCDILHTSREGPRFEEGDPVLLWVSGENGEPDVVVGRIGSPALPLEPVAAPDVVTLEAGRQLTLKVGSGSITIREDGRILIKGKDLVSHATRVNRIKGGAVQIN